MPLLREPTSTDSTANDEAAVEPARPNHSNQPIEPNRAAAAKRGRRRGSRVRGALVSRRGGHSSGRRNGRNNRALDTLGLPDPLLTAAMALDDDPRPVSTEPGPDEDDDLVDTAEWELGRAVHAIDLSDGPKVIIRPEPRLMEPATPQETTGSRLAVHDTPIPTAALDAAARLAPRRTAGRTQVPDPIQLATEPSRLPEALLITVLSLVAGLAAWGTAAPSQVWVPLTALPVVGLIALILPGGNWARALRATALLTAAASLPLLSPSMTPVTLVVALAAVATYPMLVGTAAGRAITLLAAGSLIAPLAIQAFAAEPLDLHFLIEPDRGAIGAVRLALGSGILVVALIGSLAMTSRRTLADTASIAVIRERTARAASAQVGLASACDSATGLPNREALLRAVTIALDSGDLGLYRSPRRQVGLVLVEIDRFAVLADSLGAAVADDLAAQVAQRLRAEHPVERFLARVGRHQFAMMIQGATDDSCATAARSISTLMTEPVISGGRELSVTCSIGAAISGPGLSLADDLLQAADEACRAAQRSGRSRWVMFDLAVRAHAQSQATLEIELRDAVRNGSIEVAFQPLLSLGTNGTDDRIVGAEALARWTRPDGSTVEPLRFIPMADELGLGLSLGMQVIEHALAALVTWRHEGVGVDQVWVNVAPSQLNDPEFAHEVAAQLAIRGLTAASLVLEVSAGCLPESDQALSTLGMLRSLGIAVALDDFGRSGTSLSTLRRLPISAVKLDHQLAVELGRQDAVPRSIAQLCRTLGLRVIVEGVGTMVQLHGARQIEADAVQGFAIARPMSAEDITNLLTLRLPRDFRLP
jgi:diguanylate cyclase (GGDEF)-like protein